VLVCSGFASFQHTVVMSRQAQQSMQPDDEADMCVVGPAPQLAIPVPRYPSREVGEAGYAAMLQFIAKAPLSALESLVQGSIISSRDVASLMSAALACRRNDFSKVLAALRSNRGYASAPEAGSRLEPRTLLVAATTADKAERRDMLARMLSHLTCSPLPAATTSAAGGAGGSSGGASPSSVSVSAATAAIAAAAAACGGVGPGATLDPATPRWQARATLGELLHAHIAERVSRGAPERQRAFVTGPLVQHEAWGAPALRAPLGAVPGVLALLREQALRGEISDAEREAAAVLNVPVPLMQVPLSKAKALVFFPGLHTPVRGSRDPLMQAVAAALAPTCWMSLPPKPHVAWYAAFEAALRRAAEERLVAAVATAAAAAAAAAGGSGSGAAAMAGGAPTSALADDAAAAARKAGEETTAPAAASDGTSAGTAAVSDAATARSDRSGAAGAGGGKRGKGKGGAAASSSASGGGAVSALVSRKSATGGGSSGGGARGSGADPLETLAALSGVAAEEAAPEHAAAAAAGAATGRTSGSGGGSSGRRASPSASASSSTSPGDSPTHRSGAGAGSCSNHITSSSSAASAAAPPAFPLVVTGAEHGMARSQESRSDFDDDWKRVNATAGNVAAGSASTASAAAGGTGTGAGASEAGWGSAGGSGASPHSRYAGANSVLLNAPPSGGGAAAAAGHAGFGGGSSSARDGATAGTGGSAAGRAHRVANVTAALTAAQSHAEALRSQNGLGSVTGAGSGVGASAAGAAGGAVEEDAASVASGGGKSGKGSTTGGSGTALVKRGAAGTTGGSAGVSLNALRKRGASAFADLPGWGGGHRRLGDAPFPGDETRAEEMQVTVEATPLLSALESDDLHTTALLLATGLVDPNVRM
jgi:hypothetical protein